MSVPEPVRPLSRVLRSIAGYGVATALMLVTPLLVFAPASLFHCAMRNGRFAAWMSGIVAIGLAGLYFAQVANASAGSQVKLAYSSFIGIALSVAVPSLLCIPLVENRRKFGVVLTFALVCATIGLASTELIMNAVSFSPYGAQVVQFTDATNLAIRLANANRAQATLTATERAAFWVVTQFPRIVPAMILLNIGLIFVLSLMMFGRLSAWRAFAMTRVADSETRRTYLFRNLQLPEWLLFLFVFGGLTPVLSGTAQQIAANVLAILISLYVLQGLAIFRSILVRAEAGLVGSAFAFFLLAVLCLLGIGLVLLAGVGLFDPFFDFRKLNRKDDSHEGRTD